MEACMTQGLMEGLTGSARWILAPAAFVSPVFMQKFTAHRGETVKLAVSALGFMHIYVNGVRIDDTYFQPSASLYRERDLSQAEYPIRDRFTCRAYVSEYDLSGYVADGENLLEIHVGDGWYRQTERIAEGNMAFGDRLGVIYALRAGERCMVSDGDAQCRESALLCSQLFIGEVYDARRDRDHAFASAPVTVMELPGTILTLEDSQPDRIIRELRPRLLHREDGRTLWDAGENISGFVRLSCHAPEGQRVVIRFAEEIAGTELDTLSTGSNYKGTSGEPQIQQDVFISAGSVQLWQPDFLWHTFRYFEILGDASPDAVCVVHADTPVTSGFASSSPALDWLWDAFVRTQLDNMHSGFPSDCPHRERLGYTGDGQIAAPAAMTCLDCQGFYRKWIRDIFDSQDTVSGHVNHTAPFGGGGGGPGGWSCAAILVPWAYYRYFGDEGPLRAYYGHMKRWIGYLKTRMEAGLVVREEEGGWCLGEWCTPEPVKLPEPFVNTCYTIYSLSLMEKIAGIVGFPADIPAFAALRQRCESGVRAAYLDPATGSYLDGIQGADAYAIWCGLGDARTEAALRARYRRLEQYDTGFLGTDILTEALFALGEADTAYALLTAEGLGSYSYMAEHGATTIWERWSGSGSHCHPMFGGPARQLFSSILGITQAPDSAGFRELVIAPQIPAALAHVSGHQRIPQGEVKVAYARRGDDAELTVTLPCDGRLVWNGAARRLGAGEHRIRG